jgi:chorismate mutase
MTGQLSPLQAVRARIDAIDQELLRLLDERASMPAQVAAAKAAEAGGAPGFALRPAREAQMIRRFLGRDPAEASASLVVRVWRELIGDSLSRQGPFQIVAWGGRSPARIAELARLRFGAAPPLRFASTPEEAMQASRAEGTVAVVALETGNAWWARLLAEPSLRVVACLPCLSAWGPLDALAVAALDPEPSGFDQTLFASDAAADAVIEALSTAGLAADLLRQAGAMKLFSLAGFVQAEDPRLEAAPGRLKGVIGAAPAAFDL